MAENASGESQTVMQKWAETSEEYSRALEKLLGELVAEAKVCYNKQNG